MLSINSLDRITLPRLLTKTSFAGDVFDEVLPVLIFGALPDLYQRAEIVGLKLGRRAEFKRFHNFGLRCSALDQFNQFSVINFFFRWHQ